MSDRSNPEKPLRRRVLDIAATVGTAVFLLSVVAVLVARLTHSPPELQPGDEVRATVTGLQGLDNYGAPTVWVIAESADGNRVRFTAPIARGLRAGMVVDVQERVTADGRVHSHQFIDVVSDQE